MTQTLPSTTSGASAPLPFLFVGDHPAMDLLNTVYKTADGTQVDSLKSDSDVQRWLAQAGWPVENEAGPDRNGSLLNSARTLRNAIRAIVEAQHAGKSVSAEMLSPLNRLLTHARSHVELHRSVDGTLRLERAWTRKSPEEILAPIAESAAGLFASGDLALVKHCEDAHCVLWFLDRTKSHHRRWCSMAVCGNRNKVAAYRHRKAHEA